MKKFEQTLNLVYIISQTTFIISALTIAISNM